MFDDTVRNTTCAGRPVQQIELMKATIDELSDARMRLATVPLRSKWTLRRLNPATQQSGKIKGGLHSAHVPLTMARHEKVTNLGQTEPDGGPVRRS